MAVQGLALAMLVSPAGCAVSATGAPRSAPAPQTAPVVPFNSNFWSYWTHYWATWLPDHPVYEMIELTAYENPQDPSDVLVRVFLTERAGRKRQYYYLNNQDEVRRARATAFYREIEFNRSGLPGGPQNLEVAFTDKDGAPIRWSINFGPEATLRGREAELTPSIHSLGGILLFALRTQTVDTHDDKVLFAGVDYAAKNPPDDRTRGTRSWFNPDYYSAVLVHGKNSFTWKDGALTNTWGRTFTRTGKGGRTYRSQLLGPENFVTFNVDRHAGIRTYSHFSRGHSLNFSFEPALPTFVRAREGQVVRFSVSFDQRPALMTGDVRIHRLEPDAMVLEWVPAGPSWAVGRNFWSLLRMQGDGYELTTTENRAAVFPQSPQAPATK
jgi:hypothetical protein